MTPREQALEAERDRYKFACEHYLKEHKLYREFIAETVGETYPPLEYQWMCWRLARTSLAPTDGTITLAEYCEQENRESPGRYILLLTKLEHTEVERDALRVALLEWCGVVDANREAISSIDPDDIDAVLAYSKQAGAEVDAFYDRARDLLASPTGRPEE